MNFSVLDHFEPDMLTINIPNLDICIGAMRRADPSRFNMDSWFHSCGTPACFLGNLASYRPAIDAGWRTVVDGNSYFPEFKNLEDPEDGLSVYLRISYSFAEMLTCTTGDDAEYKFWDVDDTKDITPTQVNAMLQEIRRRAVEAQQPAMPFLAELNATINEDLADA